jgi:hypothetical protein
VEACKIFKQKEDTLFTWLYIIHQFVESVLGVCVLLIVVIFFSLFCKIKFKKSKNNELLEFKITRSCNYWNTTSLFAHLRHKSLRLALGLFDYWTKILLFKFKKFINLSRSMETRFNIKTPDETQYSRTLSILGDTIIPIAAALRYSKFPFDSHHISPFLLYSRLQ